MNFEAEGVVPDIAERLLKAEVRLTQLESMLSNNKLTLQVGKNKVTVGAYESCTGVWLEKEGGPMVSIFNDISGAAVGIYSDKEKSALNICLSSYGLQLYDNKTKESKIVSVPELLDIVRKADEK